VKWSCLLPHTFYAVLTIGLILENTQKLWIFLLLKGCEGRPMFLNKQTNLFIFDRNVFGLNVTVFFCV